MDYDIIISNARRDAVTVLNEDGSTLCRIAPGDTFHCSTEDPTKFLAKYDKVLFFEGGVDLSERPGWIEPERRWPVVVELSKDSPAVDVRAVNGRPMTFMLGFTYIVDCNPNEEWAIFDRITLNVAEQRRIESKVHDGIYEFVTVLTDQPVLRTEQELERLQREIELAGADGTSQSIE